MGKKINEVGNTYGYLTVIEEAESVNNRAMWKCQCVCGNTTVVAGKLLRNGHTKSCGCLVKEKLIERNLQKGGNLQGKRFGKLTVIEEVGFLTKPNGKRARLWKCKCDCGNICEVQHQYLTSGDTSSCGCSNSKGNATITRLLNLKNINYQEEYSFSDLKAPSGGNYRFDFAIFDEEHNLKFLIEYQGSIHFKSGTGWNTNESLSDNKRRDKIKKDYCKKNNIKLYYITYLDNIEEKLEEILNG